MLKNVKKWLDRILEFFTAVVMGILVLDVLWQVITRFVIRNPSSWTEELATYLLIWVGLLGSAVALNRRAHLGIDYFVGRLKNRDRCVSEILVFLFVAGFAIAVLFVGGIQLVSETLQFGQVAPATGIRLGYVYLAVPISGFFIAIYSIEFLVEAIVKLRIAHKHASHKKINPTGI